MEFLRIDLNTAWNDLELAFKWNPKDIFINEEKHKHLKPKDFWYFQHLFVLFSDAIS